MAKLVGAAIDTADWSLDDVEYVSTVRRLIGLAKVRNIVAYVKFELETNPEDKFLIFGLHREVLKYMKAFFGPGTNILWGGSPEHKRERYVNDFQTNHKRRVMLCQIKTAGTGLTLTAAIEASPRPHERTRAPTHTEG